MSLNVAVQMDPIARINVKGDSTFAMLLEAQARGHRLSYYTPERLALLNGKLFASVEPLTSIALAMSLITEHRCRHLPVVDGGRLVGLVSSGDLTAWLVSDQQQTIWDLYFYITH